MKKLIVYVILKNNEYKHGKYKHILTPFSHVKHIPCM